MSHSLFSPFIRRFDLEPAVAARLAAMGAGQRQLRAHAELFCEGSRPATVSFVTEGIVGRIKLLAESRQAIVGFVLPGDLCGSQRELSGQTDHGAVALTACTVADVPLAAMNRAMQEIPALQHAFALAAAVEMATQRQWLAQMSCAADKRLSHLLCEMRFRLALVGLADNVGFPLPLTQQDLSEAAGISTVHVNRILKHLKELGLIRIVDHSLLIPSLARLETFAEFSATYLDLEPSGTQPALAAIRQKNRGGFPEGALSLRK